MNNKLLLLGFALFLLVLPMAYATIDDYIAYYPFDVVYNGTTEYMGTIEGADGIVDGLNSGSYKYGINGSVDFDGSYDYASADSTNIRFPGTTDDFSLCVWQNMDNLGNNYMLDLRDANDVGYFMPFFDVSDRIGCYLNSQDTRSSDNIITNEGQWHHVCCVFDRSNSYGEANAKAYVYVDGVDVTNSSVQPDISGVTLVATSDLHIGGEYDGTPMFDGKIDEVTIYDRSLNTTEISELYNSGDGKRADEVSFTDYVYYNDMDSLKDQSGEGNHGTANGNPTQTTTGYNGTESNSAIDFDGSDDLVEVSNNFAGGDWTVSLWVNITAIGTDKIFSMAQSSTTSDYFSAALNNSNQLRINGREGDSGERDWYPTVNYNTSQWHNFVFTRNLSSGTVEVYRDGAFIISDTNNEFKGDSPNNFVLGGFHFNNNYYGTYFDGQIDEVRIYERVLNTTEIQELYEWVPRSGFPVFTIRAKDSVTYDTIYNFTINMTNGTETYNNVSDGVLINYENLTGFWNITLSHEDYDSVTYENYNVSNDLTAYLNYSYARVNISAYIAPANTTPVMNFTIMVDESSFIGNTTTGSLEVLLEKGVMNNVTIHPEGYEYQSVLLNGTEGNDYNFSVYTKNSFSINFYDTADQELIDDRNITIIFIGNTSQTNVTSNGTLYVDLFIPDEYTFVYSADDYRQAQYLITLNNNSHEDINLYLTNESLTSLILLEVEDTYGNPVQNVDITIQRYMGDNWLTEQIVSTDLQGNAEASFVLSTVYYNFLLVKDSVTYFGILNDDENQKLIYAEDVSNGIKFAIDLLGEGDYQSYYEAYGITHSLTFTNTSNTTGYFLFTFDDVNNNQWNFSMEVREEGEVYSGCSFEDTAVYTESGTITCYIETDGMTSYVAKTKAEQSPAEFLSVDIRYFGPDVRVDFGVTGYIVAFIIVLVVFFAFMKVPAVSLLLGTGVIILFALSGLIWKGTHFFGLIIIVVFALIILGKKMMGGSNG